jgi:hypothetical protein
MRKIQTFCRSAIVILIGNGFSALATVYDSDGSPTNLQYIHDMLAWDGDTITLPAGTFSWTTGVTITKAITIQGQTTTNSDTGVCSDTTVVVDNLNRGVGHGFIGATMPTGATGVLRITGITFTGVGGSSQTMYNGIIRLAALSSDNNPLVRFRIDHCHMLQMYQANNVALYQGAYGVMDHCVVDNTPSQMLQSRCFNGHASPGGGRGDVEFSQPIGFGGEKFWFMEDCYLNNNLGGFGSASCGWDSSWGGKYVVRYCKLFDIELLNHGTEDSRDRGGRVTNFTITNIIGATR